MSILEKVAIKMQIQVIPEIFSDLFLKSRAKHVQDQNPDK